MEDQMNDPDLSLYVSHDKIVIPITENESIYISCTKELTPIDMLDLYFGRTDSTGNKVWMGALFFVEVMSKPMIPSSSSSSSLNFSNDNIITFDYLNKMRTTLFDKKRVIELGAGTGVSGISLLVGGSLKGGDHRQPHFFTFTDFDRNILNLCQTNCDKNLSTIGRIDYTKLNSKQRLEFESQDNGYIVCPLSWGNHNDSTTHNNNNDDDEEENHVFLKDSSYDTLIATDVLYDLASLKPLLQSTIHLLKPEGYFVLSHVPRASVGYDSPIADTEILENIITKEAEQHGLSIITTTIDESLTPIIIRPSDIIQLLRQTKNRNNCNSLKKMKEMDEVGASIMIFQKTHTIVET